MYTITDKKVGKCNIQTWELYAVQRIMRRVKALGVPDLPTVRRVTSNGKNNKSSHLAQILIRCITV